MRNNMKKGIAWVLGMILLLSFGAAAAESIPPIVPVFEGTLNVRPIETEEEAIAYAKEIWALDYLGMDFEISYYEADHYEEDCWVVYAMDGPDDGDYCYGDVMFDLDGNVVRVENASSGVFEVLNEAGGEEEMQANEDICPVEDPDTWSDWRTLLDKELEYPFLETVCPGVYEEYVALYPLDEVNNDTLTHYNGTAVDSYDNANQFNVNYSESYRDGTWRIQVVVQISPVIRIVYFDVYVDAEEGGNG